MHHAGDECCYAGKTGLGQIGVLCLVAVLMFVRHEHGFYVHLLQISSISGERSWRK